MRTQQIDRDEVIHHRGHRGRRGKQEERDEGNTNGSTYPQDSLWHKPKAQKWAPKVNTQNTRLEMNGMLREGRRKRRDGVEVGTVQSESLIPKGMSYRIAQPLAEVIAIPALAPAQE